MSASPKLVADGKTWAGETYGLPRERRPLPYQSVGGRFAVGVAYLDGTNSGSRAPSQNGKFIGQFEGTLRVGFRESKLFPRASVLRCFDQLPWGAEHSNKSKFFGQGAETHGIQHQLSFGGVVSLLKGAAKMQRSDIGKLLIA